MRMLTAQHAGRRHDDRGASHPPRRDGAPRRGNGPGDILIATAAPMTGRLAGSASSGSAAHGIAVDDINAAAACSGSGWS
jgi:ABC-type branched-subunit amino acid transport system substrate-binding protein